MDPKSWLGVELFSCDLANQASAFGSLTPLTGGEDGLDSVKFLTWGGFDAMVLTAGATRSGMIKVVERDSSDGFFNRQCFFGFVIHNEIGSLLQESRGNPLVGLTFIKLRPLPTISGLESGLKHYDWIPKALTEIRSRLKTVIGVQDADLKFLVAVSTGWADIILVTCATSYAAIQLVVSSLRTVKTESLLQSEQNSAEPLLPIHVVATTCTVTGAHYDGEHLGLTTRASGSSGPHHEHSLRISVDVQSRPGHLNDAMKTFRDAGFDTYPTLGRSDFAAIFEARDDKALPTFFKFAATKLLTKNTSDTRSIQSTETRFGFDGPMFASEPDGIGAKPYHQYRDIPTPDFDALRDSVSPHTLAALRQVHRNLRALLHDESTFEYYRGLAHVYSVAIDNIVGRIRDILADVADSPHLADMLWQQMSDVCEQIELCFKDRYRGAYPAGESAAMPSLTSHGSFHKILASVDAVASGALTCAVEQFRVELARGNLGSFPMELAVCTHLGNSASPSVKPESLMGVGFINVPTQLMFSLDGLVFVLHETGHVFWETVPAFFESAFWTVWDNPSDSIREDVKEALCDFFSLSAGFRGDQQAMQRLVSEQLKGLLTLNQEKLTSQMSVRLTLAWIIFIAAEDGFSAAVWDKISELIGKGNPLRKSMYEKLDMRIIQIRTLTESSPRFRSALKAVHALSKDELLKAMSAPFAQTVRLVQRYFMSSRNQAEGEFAARLWRSVASSRY